MLRIGYNTNGFICHSLESAIRIIAEQSYKGVAITLDHYALNPWGPELRMEVNRTRALSIWSGTKHASVARHEAWQWLVEGCRTVAVEAQSRGIPLAFEPEPGMFIETLDQYKKLKAAVGHPMFGLTLDLGHAFLTEPVAPQACVRKFKADLHNIHIEDMRKGVHNHLFFGEGEINFPPIFDALREIEYKGPVNVELSRHSHDAVRTAKVALEYLDKLL